MKIRRKQIASLFITSLIIWIVGNGLLPLLPVYAELLGADSTTSGLYLAFAYLAIALGAFSADKVGGYRLGRKIPLIIVSSTSIPLIWLMGQVRSLWALIFSTALVWFCGGLGLALVNVIVGMSAGEHERGKVFGTLSLSSAMGSIIGGMGTGWLVKNWNYPTMFSVLAGLMVLGPLSVLFINEPTGKKTHSTDNKHQESKHLGRKYWLLFTASITIAIVGFIILLARTISMNNMGFDPFEISSTIVVGGLISLPLPYLMGSLSDRIERKNVLIVGYIIRIAAVILLAFSNRLWHFWLLSILDGIAVGSNTSVGNAYVTDIVSKGALGKGLAFIGTTSWIGGIIGFTLTGIMLQNLGFMLSCFLGAGLGAIALVMLIPIQSK